jgi:hypothetical protein
MYTNAQYVNNLSGGCVGICCDINGLTSFVPINLANTDYTEIMQLVSDGRLVIAPADEPTEG